MCIKQSIVSTCVCENHTGECVTHTGRCVTYCFLPAWALNFWRILNISGPNKKGKKRKKLVVQYFWVWRTQFLAHTVVERKLYFYNGHGSKVTMNKHIPSRSFSLFSHSPFSISDIFSYFFMCYVSNRN